jgi:hypothetical protein
MSDGMTKMGAGSGQSGIVPRKRPAPGVDAFGQPVRYAYLVTLADGQTMPPHSGDGRKATAFVAWCAVHVEARRRWRIFALDPETGERLREVPRAELRAIVVRGGRGGRPGDRIG